MIEPGTVVRHEVAIREVTVARNKKLSPGLVRVTLTGTELAGFSSLGPSDHCKLYFPDPATGAISAPRITEEGLQRPDPATLIVRDYTPRAFRKASADSAAELDIDFVLHGDDGPAAAWAASAGIGDPLIVGGPRGSRMPPTGVSRVVLAADESALPALGRWIEELPEEVEIIAFVTLSNESDASYLDPAHVHRAKVIWLGKEPGELEQAFRNLGPLAADAFVWAAGEAASLVPVRRYLRRELGLSADQVKVEGYWKAGEPNRDHHAPLDPADPES